MVFLCVATLTAESSKYPCTRFPMSKAPIIMKITNITIDQNKEDKKHWPCTQRWNSKCQMNLKKYLLHKSKKSRWYCDRNVPPLVPQQTWKGAKPPARYIYNLYIKRTAIADVQLILGTKNLWYLMVLASCDV